MVRGLEASQRGKVTAWQIACGTAASSAGVGLDKSAAATVPPFATHRMDFTDNLHG